jgi:hypothetical protein
MPALSDQEIKDFVTANAANPEAVAAMMASSDLKSTDISRAIGGQYSADDVQKAFDNTAAGKTYNDQNAAIKTEAENNLSNPGLIATAMARNQITPERMSIATGVPVEAVNAELAKTDYAKNVTAAGSSLAQQATNIKDANQANAYGQAIPAERAPGTSDLMKQFINVSDKQLTPEQKQLALKTFQNAQVKGNLSSTGMPSSDWYYTFTPGGTLTQSGRTVLFTT